MEDFLTREEIAERRGWIFPPDESESWSLSPSGYWVKSKLEIINVGRNDKCPCGSNIKYKRCCMR